MTGPASLPERLRLRVVALVSAVLPSVIPVPPPLRKIAGFAHARGKYVVTIDADLQNPPAEIPVLIEKLREGTCDVVQGWRINREDSLPRRGASKLVNWFVTRSTGMKVNDLGTGLKAYRREVVEHLAMARHQAR